jgi:hypothetical protein
MLHSWKPSHTSPKNTESRRGFRAADIIVIVGAITAPIITLVAAIVAIVWFFYSLPLEVEKLVDKRLKEKEIVEKLAKTIRPSVIFDSTSRILADLGAFEYIESVNVVKYLDKESRIPVSIEVKCKKFLPLPPLLTSLDLYAYDQTVDRGPGPEFTWIYKLEPDSYSSIVRPLRFRLEVLQ